MFEAMLCLKLERHELEEVDKGRGAVVAVLVADEDKRKLDECNKRCAPVVFKVQSNPNVDIGCDTCHMIDGCSIQKCQSLLAASVK